MSAKNKILDLPEFAALYLPAVEGSLENAGIKIKRAEISERLLSSAPRIGLLTGPPGHPAHAQDSAFVAKLIASLWESGAIPLLHYYTSVCDGIAQGHSGMNFSLLSREGAALSLSALIEGYALNGAIFITGCDKTPPATLMAAIGIDALRKAEGKTGFWSLFIPVKVMPEGNLPPELRDFIENIEDKADPDLKKELKWLAGQRLKCNTLAMWKRLFESESFRKTVRGTASDKDLDGLWSRLVENGCPGGGICAFGGTGNTGRMVFAALGLVPYGWELLTSYPPKEKIDQLTAFFTKLVKSKDPARTTGALVGANWKNAGALWSAIGGSINWILHFERIGSLLEKEFKIPPPGACCLMLSEVDNRSFYSLADCYNQKGVIDALAGKLYRELKFNFADTIDGTWEKRIAAAPKPDGSFIPQKTDLSQKSGALVIGGNIFKEAVLKIDGKKTDHFYNKISGVILCFEDEETLNQKLLCGDMLWEKGMRLAAAGRKLPSDFTDNLYLLLVVRGMGPGSCGMPEMYYPSEYLNRHPTLSKRAVLITDGRFSGATYGPCLGHARPEAVRGGNIAALKDGDLFEMDLANKKLNYIDEKGQPISYGSLNKIRQVEIKKCLGRQFKKNKKFPAFYRDAFARMALVIFAVLFFFKPVFASTPAIPSPLIEPKIQIRAFYGQDLSMEESYDSTSAKRDLEAGLLAENRNAPDVAFLYYNRVERRAPQGRFHYTAALRIGQLYFAREDYINSLKVYLKCLELKPDDKDITTIEFMIKTARDRLGLNAAYKKLPLVMDKRWIPKEPRLNHLVRTMINMDKITFLDPWSYRAIKVKLLDDLKKVRVGNFLGGRSFEKIYSIYEGKIFDGEDMHDKAVMVGISQGLVAVNGQLYRGRVEIIAEGDKLLVVNHIDMDDYLCGVLPKEIFSSWAGEALKAQAVAARTYAVYMMKKNDTHYYDLDCSMMSQVYGGYDCETENTNLAVLATKGQIITYNENPILAFYHSNSGGYLEDDCRVWLGEDRPYLVARPDKFSVNSKEYRWSYKIPQEKLRAIFFKNKKGSGKFALTDIEYSKTGRVLSISAVDGKNKITMTGNNFRIKVSPRYLKSTLFKFKIEGDQIAFSGYGYGHGVGLSQTGAQNMAQKGYDYRGILAFYYSKINFTSIK